MTHSKPVQYGATSGKVFVMAGEHIVAMTPAGARTLAQHLPRLAALAEKFAQHQTAEMADSLIQRGFRWRLTADGDAGQWCAIYPDQEYPITAIADYATATRSLYALLRFPS